MDNFRLAGSKMNDSIELRVQEYPRQKITGPIFKRMATNESLERCDKYENVRDYFFGDKLEIMDGNTEEPPPPCIKDWLSFESDNLTGAIGRRTIWNIIKPKFVRERDVDPTKGNILKINRDRLGSFLTDPYTRYLMRDKVLFTLFRKNGDDEIYKWFGDLQLVDSMFPQGESDLVGSTIRLARRLLGEEQRDFGKTKMEWRVARVALANQLL